MQYFFVLSCPLAYFLCAGQLCVLSYSTIASGIRSIYRHAQLIPGPRLHLALSWSVTIFSVCLLVILQVLGFAVTFSERHIIRPWTRIELPIKGTFGLQTLPS